MKDDEWELLVEIAKVPKTKRTEFGWLSVEEFPRDVAKRLGMNENRAWYILEKWANKGWLEYGVSPFYGWLTDKGKEVAFGVRPH